MCYWEMKTKTKKKEKKEKQLTRNIGSETCKKRFVIDSVEKIKIRTKLYIYSRNQRN